MFDLEKIKKLQKAVNILVVITIILGVGNIFDSEGIFLILSILARFALLIVWCILWKNLNKTAASIVVHAVIIGTLMFVLTGWIGIILAAYVATSQADTVLKHNGDVIVTFGNIKPRQQTEEK